jgi:hypothetical protein
VIVNTHLDFMVAQKRAGSHTQPSFMLILFLATAWVYIIIVLTPTWVDKIVITTTRIGDVTTAFTHFVILTFLFFLIFFSFLLHNILSIFPGTIIFHQNIRYSGISLTKYLWIRT